MLLTAPYYYLIKKGVISILLVRYYCSLQIKGEKNMSRFKLGNSENYIEASVIYKIKHELENTEVFIITPELLDSYDLPAEKFLTFLQQMLPFEDPYYAVCHELFSSNRGIFSKTSIKDGTKFEINKVCQIVSETTGVIDIETE